ncbi:hypothetical protein J7L02_03580 [Candidatus Woesearchaeota archaeon]|nr:hypothetical protein [Candidatus Woesearchaeota archaeon]
MSDKKDTKLADETEAEDKKLPTLEELEKELRELDNKSAGLGPELTEYFRKVAKEASDGFRIISKDNHEDIGDLKEITYYSKHGSYTVFVDPTFYNPEHIMKGTASFGEDSAIKTLFGFYHLLHKGKLSEALALLGHAFMYFNHYAHESSFVTMDRSDYVPDPLKNRTGTSREDLYNLRLKLFHYMHLGARIAARDAIKAKNKFLADEFIELGKKIDETINQYTKYMEKHLKE